jgi:hypothetical protein
MKKKKDIETFTSLSQDFAIDYGSICWITDGSSDQSQIWTRKNLVDTILSLPSQTRRVALEKTSGSYDWEDRDKFIAICEERGIQIKGINPNRTKNYRIDNNIEKTDIVDVRAIFNIAFETKYESVILKQKGPPSTEGLNSIQIVGKHIRLARQRKYPEEKLWLQKHGFPIYAAYAQAVIGAKYIVSINGSRKDFDQLTGLYGQGIRSIMRASFNRDLLTGEIKRAKENKNSLEIRKKHFRNIRKTARKIYSIMRQELTGTPISEMGTDLPEYC